MASALLLRGLQGSTDKTVDWLQHQARHHWLALALWIAFWAAIVLLLTYREARLRNMKMLLPRSAQDPLPPSPGQHAGGGHLPLSRPNQPMPNLDRDLASGETLVYRTGLHWIVLVSPTIAGTAIIVAGMALMARTPSGIHRVSSLPIDSGWLGILVIIVGVLVIGFGILRRESTQLTVTNGRVTVVTGVVSRRTLEILLPQVESIEVDQGLFGQLLGFGSIVVRGTGGTPEPLALIADPVEFKRQVQEQTGGQHLEGTAG